MLNEERVRMMTKMSLYEEKLGAEDLKISTYYKKDYSSLNVLISILWMTIGYAIIAGLIAVSNLEAIMADLSVTKLIFLVAVAVGVYVILVIAYAIGCSMFYKKKYNRAKMRVKHYYRNLSRLRKMYAKESK